jgi:predicted RNA-binding Zn ribbon-like protein
MRSAVGSTLIPAPRDDLCLTFANTLSWRGSPTPSEILGGIGDLLDWLGGTAKMPAESIAAAGKRLRRNAREAATLFADAIGLREALYRIFSAVAEGVPVADKDLARLNRALGESPARERLAPANGGYAWTTKNTDVSAASLLAPVLWSAADLLTDGDRRRVRRCANDACLWLFIDESKAATRRWCDMASCGNRAKSRRHYLKTKAG